MGPSASSSQRSLTPGNQLSLLSLLLTSFSLSRLALQFANCQLVQSGQKSWPCEAGEKVSSCLEKVDTNAWTSYTSFYTHTHNMCYYLKSRQWQVSGGTGSILK